MSLTLGLSSALSGLLTAQQSLNVISQNITNVNTPGYDREIANLNPVTLNGVGAGVQLGPTTRAVSSALMKSLNSQATTLGQYNAEQEYYPQIENLFGQVGDSSSISATIDSLATSLQQLSTEPDQAAQQSSTVQAAQSVTAQMNTMSQTLQNLRLSADSQLAGDVTQVNADLTNLATLNTQIIQNGAVGASTAELEDQRDNTLTDLSKYMQIQSYTNGNGATTVMTTSGQVLLDSQPHLLAHAATTVTSANQSAAAGNFDPITVGGSSTDITSSITTGEMGALIQMRDNTIPNMQAQLDEVSSQLKNVINQISNRGTSLPNITNTYTGTTVFASQGTITPTATAAAGNEAADSISYNQGNSTIAAPLTFAYSTTNGQITIAGGATSLAALSTSGTVFSVSGSTNTGNNGSYTVTGYDAATNTLTVTKPNAVQTFSVSGGDVMVSLFDSSGNQINNVAPPTIPSLSSIMATDYSNGNGNSLLQAQTGANGAPATAWSIAAFSAHMTAYLQQQGYAGASAGLNSAGQMVITLGSTAQATLAFRDQTSGTAGAAAGDVTVNFDPNGDGTNDTTTQGFSNFFGLNDVLVTNQPVSSLASQIQPSTFATVTQRTLTLSDSLGQVGSPITIKAGSSLQTIAASINAATQSNQSVELACPTANQSPSFTLTSAAQITVESNGTGVGNVINLAAGTYTLDDIAKALTDNSSGAIVGAVQYSNNGADAVLTARDTGAKPLTISITGGQITPQNTLSSVLDMQPVQRITAAVVPEGSGSRLVLTQVEGQQIFAAAGQDAQGKSLLTDLGLGSAIAGTASNIAVNSSLQSNPAALSRGTVQWNADTQQYYLSEGDNTTSLQMANAMTTQYKMDAAGGIAAGTYTFSGAATTTISLVATASNNSQQQQTYQTTLNNSLQSQYTSYSGVNIDQEVTQMMAYQQAYSASAKVISVLQEMMQTLSDLIR